MSVDDPQWGVEGYALRSLITDDHVARSSVYWTMHGYLRSMMWRGTRKVLKVRDGFQHHRDPSQFIELIRESREYGCERPGSYAGMWWGAKKRPGIPTVPNWQKRFGLIQVAGAWQRAFLAGELTGQWVHYDIRSAYLWAISLGLPDPRTFRWSTDLKRHRHGMWLLQSSPRGDLPYPYGGGGDVLATTDEIDGYGLSIQNVYGGILWDGSEYAYDTSRIVDSVMRYSSWKAIGRSWWGMLMSSVPVRAHYLGTGNSRDIQPHFSNPVWAHLIVGRVRQRLWEIVQENPGDVARVYCDSVVVRDRVRIEIGEKVGDWREESRYGHGVTVHNAVQISGGIR